ncbi:uncharacterized protein LOC128966200 [Oppia nitens]|uniref:uncharacterized protein LOC128966200 n=1 Tax=Oppia nitens TaxID=1686743 RepID=UPI0023DA8523|nr:uncharacterized protein LOC128966200 [Oppia nitens]
MANVIILYLTIILLTTTPILCRDIQQQAYDDDDDVDNRELDTNGGGAGNALHQAMAVLDMVTRFQEFKGRALTAIPDPVQALAELSLFGAIKLGVVLLSGLVLLGAMFPTVMAAYGLSLPLLIRSLNNGMDDMKHMDYETVALSMRSLPEKAFQALDIQEEDCRSRAVCEIGQYGAQLFPTAASYARAFGTRLPFSQKYLMAIVKGLTTKTDCSVTFRKCQESPFKKLSYLSTYNIF